MSNFADWVTDPNAYNWITLLGAISAFLAAVFTGYSAFLAWRGQRQSIRTEWHHEFWGSDFRLMCEIFNDTDQTLEVERIKLRGPVRNVFDKHKGTKHESWPHDEAPVFKDVCEPRKTISISFTVHPNPTELRRSANSLPQRVRLSLTILLWRLAKWRFPCGPKFSATLIARRRSSQMRPIRFTHSMRIDPTQAINMADTIENSADKT